MEARSSGLAEGTFTHWAISLGPCVLVSVLVYTYVHTQVYVSMISTGLSSTNFHFNFLRLVFSLSLKLSDLARPAGH